MTTGRPFITLAELVRVLPPTAQISGVTLRNRGEDCFLTIRDLRSTDRASIRHTLNEKARRARSIRRRAGGKA